MDDRSAAIKAELNRLATCANEDMAWCLTLGLTMRHASAETIAGLLVVKEGEQTGEALIQFVRIGLASLDKSLAILSEEMLGQARLMQRDAERNTKQE